VVASASTTEQMRQCHAERPVQGSRRQEYWAAHARGSRAQQAGKLETRAFFAGSQGGTVAPAGSNTYAPRPVRLDLRPRGPARPDVALARRLAVIMHRVWVDGTEFRWTREVAVA
jgi:hypothetical protein